MKQILYSLVTILIFTSCESPQKIGYVNNGKVINEYQEKKDIEERYKAKDEAFKKRTDCIGRAFQLEYQALQLKISKLSAQNQQAESQAINQKGQLLQQQMQFE